jgi:prepilin-type N-terminal cleavage/methylation domain-containing protein
MINRHRQAGFSLIELLIVMAISLVLLGMVAPAIRTRDNASAEVRRVVADAARARSWARTTWHTTTLDVDTTNRRWRIVDDTGETLDASHADANGWRTLATGVAFAAVQGNPTDMEFQSDGRGSANAAVQIVAGNSIWTVTLSAMTGTVTADTDS